MSMLVSPVNGTAIQWYFQCLAKKIYWNIVIEPGGLMKTNIDILLLQIYFMPQRPFLDLPPPWRVQRVTGKLRL